MPDLRASDADREQCVAALRHHAAAGRLDVDELEERTSRAYAARTLAELAELLSDLPAVAPAPRPGVPAPPAPRVPGRAPFSARWQAPSPVGVTMAELMAHVVPPLLHRGYELVDRRADGLRLRRERRPLWTIALAVLLFPFGLVALLVKTRDEISIDLIERDGGTWITAGGIAPLEVRRAFAALEE